MHAALVPPTHCCHTLCSCPPRRPADAALHGSAARPHAAAAAGGGPAPCQSVRAADPGLGLSGPADQQHLAGQGGAQGLGHVVAMAGGAAGVEAYRGVEALLGHSVCGTPCSGGGLVVCFVPKLAGWQPSGCLFCARQKPPAPTSNSPTLPTSSRPGLPPIPSHLQVAKFAAEQVEACSIEEPHSPDPAGLQTLWACLRVLAQFQVRRWGFHYILRSSAGSLGAEHEWLLSAAVAEV